MTADSPAQPTCSSAADLLAAIESAEGGRPIMDPATGERVGRAPEHSVANLEAALDTAAAYQNEEGVGKAIGNEQMEVEGKGQQVKGKVQNAIGGVKDALKEDRSDRRS